MAAEILLLVALISSNIHADIVALKGKPHRFFLKRSDDFCLISRWSGEEKKLLWNSSWRHDSSLQTEASYEISSLDVSDSGQYQEQCWTQNNVTHERNSTLLVCDTQNVRYQTSYQKGFIELKCDAAEQKQRIRWATEYRNYKTGNMELDLHLMKTYLTPYMPMKSSLFVPSYDNFNRYYYCLNMNLQKCDILMKFTVDFHIHRGFTDFYSVHSVGESLEMKCSDISGNKSHLWKMTRSLMKYEESHNSTLTFPSLTLNHTGRYICHRSDQDCEYHYMFVCPESDPPAVFFVTEGENLSQPCGHWKQTEDIYWIMRTNRTEGKVFIIEKFNERIFLSDGSLTITNLSLEDSGEFWCFKLKDNRCVFTSKTLVMFREPEVDHHLVRPVLLSVVIVLMCVVVVLVWRSTIREHFPVPVEEVEMSDLSPASAEIL